MKFPFGKMATAALLALAHLSKASPINQEQSLSLPSGTSGGIPTPGEPLPLIPRADVGQEDHDVSDLNRRDEVSPEISYGIPQYYGGRVIGNIEVTPVYWGPNGEWSDPQLRDNQTNHISDFVKSPYVDNLAQFNTSTTTIGRGSCNPAVIVDENIPYNQSINQLNDLGKQIIANAIKQGAPAPNKKSLYAVYAPKDIRPFGVASTHIVLTDGPYAGTAMAFFPSPTKNSTGTLDNGSIDDQLSLVMTAEIVQSIVDPNGDGWHMSLSASNSNSSSGNANITDNEYEIADACILGDDPKLVQRYKNYLVHPYADKDGKCFVLPDFPLENVTFTAENPAQQEGSGGWSAGKKAGVGASVGVVCVGIAVGLGALAQKKRTGEQNISSTAAQDPLTAAEEGRDIPLQDRQDVTTPTIPSADNTHNNDGQPGITHAQNPLENDQNGTTRATKPIVSSEITSEITKDVKNADISHHVPQKPLQAMVQNATSSPTKKINVSTLEKPHTRNIRDNNQRST